MEEEKREHRLNGLGRGEGSDLNEEEYKDRGLLGFQYKLRETSRALVKIYPSSTIQFCPFVLLQVYEA